MANWSSSLRKSYGFSEDFEEEDVWNSEEDSSSFVTRKSTDYYYSSSSSSSSVSSSSSSTWRLPTAPKMIPKSISTRTHETQMATSRSSAPVDIPDWSKIYGKMGSSAGGKPDDRDQEDVDGEEDGMVPPHEWIAQKMARSRISSFSVCEGAGRTLKGRDLSKVRNAILTKTGFLE